jgi:hypothetical protein
MNTETETTVTQPETNHGSNIQSVDFSSEAKQIHRKIAKLPKPLRDLINSSLDDGLPANEIIQKLQASTNPPLSYPITEVNISRWKSTGYLRYLAHQDHLDSIEASREAALEIVATNNLSLPQATLQVIAGQCFEILAEFSPAAVKQKLAEDPLKYMSFLHVFARLTREIVHLEKFHEVRLAAQAEKSDPNRDRQADAAKFWTRHLDTLFHRKDPRAIKTNESVPESPSSSSNTVPSLAPSSPFLPSSEPLLAQEDHASLSHPSSASSHPASRIQHPKSDPSPIENQNNRTSLVSKIENPEHCLECRNPLPPLTPEGKRPNERCEQCNILLPPPGTCTRPSSDKCHHCGNNLPHRLPNGRRPKYTCHNCGAGLGRELDEDTQKYAEE